MTQESIEIPGTRIHWLDHTADVGVAIEADDLEDLFAAALECLTAVMLSAPPDAADGSRAIRLSAGSIETLLVEWLEEWIFLVQTERRVPVSVDLEITQGPAAAGMASGERWELQASVRDTALDPDRHEWRGEVKGATYHGLDVRPLGSGWQAQIVFDV